MHVRVCPIRNDLIGVYLRNIDEQKRAGTALRASEERLRIASQVARLGYWERDLVSDELQSSDQCKANYGLPPEAELTYQAVFAAIHPEYRDRVREASRRSVREGTPYELEYPIYWPDGSTHWISVRGQCMSAEDGTPLRNVGVTLDITARKHTEQALQELNEQLERQVEERARQLMPAGRVCGRFLRTRRIASRCSARQPMAASSTRTSIQPVSAPMEFVATR